MALIGEVTRWGPAMPVALLLAVAVFEAAILPRRLWAKGAWVLAVVLCGVGSAALLRWQQQAGNTATSDQLASETAALRGLWSQWDTLSRSLPPPADDGPAANFDSVDEALASLSAKVASIADQIAALKTGGKGRSVDAETAVRLADYLRQYGSYRAVVSCPPGDVEAYTYANQLANILRAAGWDANGPEATRTSGEGQAMGISLYVRNPAAPEAAKILIDAFGRYNIPYQSAIAENDAIPDQATVELYVADKP
ncbi:MAG TPA: hypothetical protein VFC56_14765 [Stellaceae bacterium]|nr:hypothetical protein [Stellaceae bacterium]